MAFLNGFICKRNNFWRLIHNPIYCGLIVLLATKDEDMQLIKGIHEPIITEELFNDVQTLIHSKRRERRKKDNLKSIFPLRGFIICPYCNRTLTGSISKGRYPKYRYYHCCTPRCQGRFRSDILENYYENQLKEILIVPAAQKLFRLVLDDENGIKVQKDLLHNRAYLLNEVSKEELYLSKVRKLFIEDKIDHEDFTSLKKEQKEKLASLNERLINIDEKIKNNNVNMSSKSAYVRADILLSYKKQDIEGKRYIINLFRPSSIDIVTRNLNPLEIDPALLPIILRKKSDKPKSKKTYPRPSFN